MRFDFGFYSALFLSLVGFGSSEGSGKGAGEHPQVPGVLGSHTREQGVLLPEIMSSEMHRNYV